MFNIKNNEILLLKEIKKHGKVTRKSQSIYLSRLGFYLAVWKLRDMNLVYPTKNNNAKEWRLTKKGERIVGLITKIEKELEG